MKYLKPPYSKTELVNALKDLDLQFTESELAEKMVEFRAKVEASLPSDGAAAMKLLADIYKTSPEDLLRVFSRQFLLDMYIETVITKCILSLAETLGISEVQAWALYIFGNKPDNTKKDN